MTTRPGDFLLLLLILEHEGRRGKHFPNGGGEGACPILASQPRLTTTLISREGWPRGSEGKRGRWWRFWEMGRGGMTRGGVT